MTNNEIFDKQISDTKYYNPEDLRMNKNYGFLLSQKQLLDYISFKENLQDEKKIIIPLKTWNSKQIFYIECSELLSSLNDFKLYFQEDLDLHQSFYVDRNFEEINLGLICSELEGTLKIENVNTTRRQVESILKNGTPRDKNEQIIYNMYQGLKFISKKPIFNKLNLKKLYDLLSEGCLKDEDIIKEGYYRTDMVYIGSHSGCPVDEINSCMDSLFKFVNSIIENTNRNSYINSAIIPYIAHYYMVYIHPYFDYNGRTARMVQIWIYYLLNTTHTLFLSEAINDNKNQYYKALENTRNTNNDLTYFLIYLTKLCNSYYLVHKNIEKIESEIESKGESISQSDLHYIKRIILNKNIGWFNHKAFISFAGLDITKQGALKILNGLEEKNLLISKINSSKEKVFLLNENILTFEI